MKYALITTFVIAILGYLWAIFFAVAPISLVVFLCFAIALKLFLIARLMGWIEFKKSRPTYIYAFGWYAHLYTDCYRRSLHIDRYGRNLEIHWRRLNIVITELPF